MKQSKTRLLLNVLANNRHEFNYGTRPRDITMDTLADIVGWINGNKGKAWLAIGFALGYAAKWVL
jgi:hypothetical protein